MGKEFGPRKEHRSRACLSFDYRKITNQIEIKYILNCIYQDGLWLAEETDGWSIRSGHVRDMNYDSRL